MRDYQKEMSHYKVPNLQVALEILFSLLYYPQVTICHRAEKEKAKTKLFERWTSNSLVQRTRKAGAYQFLIISAALSHPLQRTKWIDVI